MKWRALLAILLAATGGALFAQGMSEEYVRQRADERLSKPHGFSLEWDAFAYVPWFEQMQKVRGDGLPADRLAFVDDMGGFPVGIFGGTELRARFTWNDSVHFGYAPYILRAFDDDIDDFKRWNGVLYPGGTDLDYAADFHDFHVHYRRDLLRMGLDKNVTFFGKIGLEYAYVRTRVASDTFVLGSDDRDVEDFSEVLPWYNVGIGMEMLIGQRIRLTAEARGTYQVGMPTFQERDDEDMKQSIVSLTGVVAFDYHITDWFVLTARARFRYLRMQLYGGDRKSQFLWYSIVPDIGFGLRV